MSTSQKQPVITLDDVWCLFAETSQLIKTQSAEADHRFQETDRRFQETDRLFKAQAIESKRLEGLFTSQWGKLMESLVEGDVVGILNRFGIEVMDESKGHPLCF